MVILLEGPMLERVIEGLSHDPMAKSLKELTKEGKMKIILFMRACILFMRTCILEILFSSRPHVILLDVGMTAELSGAVALRDGLNAAKCTLRLSKKQRCPNPKAFVEDVEKSFDLWDSPVGESIHPGECIQQLLEHVRRHKVNIDGNVCTVIVTTLVLEGWQRKLDPQLDVMRTLQTLLFKVDWVN
ncbi:probable serine/threonine-protein kinase abkC [Hibiscus syriacus]|uniref:probable serine/threonine-protein kinase abkC n=1 Tax=Hibiscus syriacus TaxID=106335 RepID=UPI0019229EDC|nr:probable serine/threonine-protein kinase abkC [Hibiscus syriacus]